MESAILLALAASFCTATASVCQRAGARRDEVTGFARPGPAHPGARAPLRLAYMAVSRRVTVRRRDWLAAVAMSAGISLFLRLASPSGGRPHAPGSSWWPAGLITLAIVLLVLGMAFGPGRRPGASRSRRAALLGAATGISWGFVAAVIKELSSHLGDGVGAIFSNWSPYVLVAVGAATMLLASHALAAGPLAASQPGFTILDPFHRHRRRHGPQPQPPHHRRQTASRIPATRPP
jgi:hypothetical protein